MRPQSLTDDGNFQKSQGTISEICVRGEHGA